MTQNPIAVLDASALLAYLQGEPGADDVADVLLQKAAISAINWAAVVGWAVPQRGVSS